jgi:hypothetical protein
MSLTMAVAAGEQALFLMTYSADTALEEFSTDGAAGYVRVLVDGSPASPTQTLPSTS